MTYESFEPIPEPEKQEYRFNATDMLLAWSCFVLGFLANRAIPANEHPLGKFLVTLLFFGVGMTYLLLNKRPMRLRQLLLLVIAPVFAFSYLTNGNVTVLFFVGLFLVIVFCAWIYDGFGLTGVRLNADLIPVHLREAVLRAPFKHLKAVFAAAVLSNPEHGKLRRAGKTVGMVLLGLVVAIVPTVIILLLLSYDDGFTSLMGRIFDFKISFDDIWGGFWDILLAIPLGAAVFSLMYGSKWKAEEGNNGEPSPIKGLHRMPKALLCAAVTPVLFLYVVFFISQWDYYVSAFTHVLPENLTYATYAREGFFQLCAVCGINAVIMLLFSILVQKREDGSHSAITRIYSVVISLFTLILIVTALSKMLLYIDSYGLTQKRVYASWFMVLLGMAFVCVLIRQLVKRFPAMTVGIVGAVLLFGVIALPNVDGMIANYNVSAYLSGELNEIDVGYPATILLDDGSFLTVFYTPVGSDNVPSIVYVKWKMKL